MKITLSEYGSQNNLADDQLCEFAKEKFGMDEEDVRLMLAIERGETDGDIIESD
jgi:hypothetical protein